MTASYSRWHAKTSKDIPQRGSVDAVIRFGEVDEAQVQGGVLPRQFLQSSYYEHHVNRRALGSEPTLFLRQNVLAFAIVTQATRDDFEEYFAGVSHEGDATIIATLSPIFLLVKHLNRSIFPLLGYATPPPHSMSVRFIQRLRGTGSKRGETGSIIDDPRPSSLVFCVSATTAAYLVCCAKYFVHCSQSITTCCAVRI